MRKSGQRKRGGAVTMTSMVRALDPTGGLKLRHRFQTRLLGYLILLSLAISLSAGYIYYGRQVEFIRAEQHRRGQTLISNLAGQSELGAYSADRTFLVVPAHRVFREPDVSYVAIYDLQGKPLIKLSKPGASFDATLEDNLRRRLLGSASSSPLTIRLPDHNDLFVPILTVDDDVEQGLYGHGMAAGSETIGIARLGLSHRLASEKLREVLRWGIYLALLTLAMGMLLALFLARRISRPILALARGADELRQGKLGFQIDIARSDELGLLADLFNRMSARLKETIESLADFNRNLEQEVARRTVALRRSRDFITLLNVPLQLQKLLDTALDALVRITGAVAAVTYICDAKGRFDIAVCQGVLPRAAEPDGPLLQLMRDATDRAKTTVIEPLPPGLSLTEHHPTARVLLLAPVRYQERLEALLVLLQVSSPNSDQLDFVADASAQLGIAVANARAFREAERLARELEQRNLVLLEQRDQLKEVSRLKSEFLANMSHELRTPLNAIIGYAELLNDRIYGELNEEQMQSLAAIGDNSRHLLRLINDVLDLSRVEAGKMPLKMEPVELNGMIREVVEVSASLTRQRPYDISTHLPRERLVLETDASKVRQILVNLLSNAIKFTAKGSVTISARPAPQTGAEITVSDTGIGIAAENIDVIFDEFRQADGSSTRAHGGTGLGLAISKKLADLIGGEIRVRSTPGAGSHFTLVLPGTRSPRHPPTGAEHVGQA